MSDDKKYEYLTTDPITVPGQKYMLVSYVSPTANQKADGLALKFRGAFADLEEAKAHAQRLQKMDGAFDVYIAEMYNWVPFPPPKDIESEYQEEWLNNYVKGHHEQQELAKQHFDQRKGEMINKIAEENKQIEQSQASSSTSHEDPMQPNSVEAALQGEDPWVANKSN